MNPILPIAVGVALAIGAGFTYKAFTKGNPANKSFGAPTPATAKSIHTYRVLGLDGKIIDFSTFKGKKVVIVNTASECGFTPQYKALEELYKQHGGKVMVVGFPCDDFGGQEPGSSEEIASFCQKNYGVTFPLAAKTTIKKNPAPIWQFLTRKADNGVMDADVKWNFTKFVIDENGYLTHTFGSPVSPTGDKMREALK